MERLNGDGRAVACITVGKEGSAICGFAGVDIQSALDEASRLGGGLVLLTEGTFEISAPLIVGNHVHLRGAGEATVLRMTEGTCTELLEDADYGETCVTVKDAAGFAEGMGFQLHDRINRFGWDEFVGRITAVDGNRISFDPYLHRDYSADENGMVTNAGSVIRCVSVTGARVSDLAIDGRLQPDSNVVGGCRGGGVYMYQAEDCSVERVKVTGYAGDGISWQMTRRVRVADCTVERCLGAGLHPGAGTYDTVVERCSLIDNRGDGIYVCWRVQRGRFIDNECFGNEGHGISIGHRDTHNDFSGNRIGRNVQGGVLFRMEKESNGPHHNRLVANVIEDNGGSQGGYGIQIHGKPRGLTIAGNTIRCTGSGKQLVGVWFADGCDDSEIKDNLIEGHSVEDIGHGGC
jgi:hypothetical protein